MPELAGPVTTEPPTDFIRRLRPRGWSSGHVKLLWLGLTPETRAGYRTAVRSYEEPVPPMGNAGVAGHSPDPCSMDYGAHVR